MLNDRFNLSLLGVAIAALVSPGAHGQMPSFAWLGPVDSYPVPNAISGDGTRAAGTYYSAGQQAFRWTSIGGIQGLGTLGGNTSIGAGINGDGNVIVGSSDTHPDVQIQDIRAFRWVDGGGMGNLGALFGHNLSRAYGVSSDGTVTVGFSGQFPSSRAVMWDSNGIQDLGVLPGHLYSQAYGVSANGSTVIGFSGNAAPNGFYPFRWRAGVGMQQIGVFPGHSLACSADGSVVVGQVIVSGNNRAFRWSESSGMQLLGVLPGNTASRANAVSADGSIVVGTCSGGSPPNTKAFRWVVGGQMRRIFDELGSYGIGIDACECDYAYGISADGTTIVGEGCYPEKGDFCTGWIATLPVDSDKDGLLDPWETQGGGIDGDGNGSIDVNLYELGARTDHRDLFVEIDAMSPAVALSPAAQAMLFNAFSFAPFENPDGIGGIELHVIDAGVDAIDFEEVWHTDDGGCWPVGFGATKDAHFGSPGDSSAVKAAKARAFRYCIAVNQLTNPATAGGVGGCGEMPGNDFVIAIGGYDDESAAAVFMHELGHNLGLDHGGSDGVNGKPNYISIMNYALSYRADFSSDFWRLDFSRSELDPLVENDLDEALGIATPAGFDDDTVYMPYGYDQVDGEGNVERKMHYCKLNGSPIDWDRDGYYDRTGADVTNTDLNYAGPSAPVGGLNVPAPDQVLASFGDWANIELPLPNTDSLADSPSYPQNEPPPAPLLVAWLNANIPALCLSDLNGDGTTDVDDLLAVINGWNAPGNSDLNGDGTTNVDDLLAVINAWGECQ
jgi:probable HAF family extracellular repeat protein